MAGKFEGIWKLRVMYQHAGTDLFLEDLDKIEVPAYAVDEFSFKFKIKSNEVAVTLNEEAGQEAFSGTFQVGSATFVTRGRKLELQSKYYIIADIVQQKLLPQTDVISYTAIKTG